MELQSYNIVYNVLCNSNNVWVERKGARKTLRADISTLKVVHPGLLGMCPESRSQL